MGDGMLSDTTIKKAAKGEKDYKLADEKGLFLLVRKNGGKLWHFKYRVAGKEKLLSFGPYPASRWPTRAIDATQPAACCTKRIRQRISGVFLLAISKRIARDNPAKDLEAALLPKPKAKKQLALLDLAELRDLPTKTEETGASPVTLLALTAVRPGVVRGARWEEYQGILGSNNVAQKWQAGRPRN